jgi:hypothetical protein
VLEELQRMVQDRFIMFEEREVEFEFCPAVIGI